MNSTRCNLFFSLLIALTALTTATPLHAQYIHTIEASEYYTVNTSTRGTYYYKKYIPSGTLPVVTLKWNGGTADYNMYVYSDRNFKRLIQSGVNRGARNELQVLPVEDYGRYVYIRVDNISKSKGYYDLYVDSIDLVDVMGEAFADTGDTYMIEESIKFILDANDSSNDATQANANRAAIRLVSSIQGNDLANVSQSLLINEIQKTFQGDEFLASFMVNFGITLVNKIYNRS